MSTEKGMTTLPERLLAYANDPMWIDHAEVPKSLLREAATALQPSVGGEVVDVCPDHGMYYKRGCASCDADIDMLTRIEPPDLASPTQPSGFVLVPVELTDEMLNAAQETTCRFNSFTAHDDAQTQAIWNAMLTAAQEAK